MTELSFFELNHFFLFCLKWTDCIMFALLLDTKLTQMFKGALTYLILDMLNVISLSFLDFVMNTNKMSVIQC